jgi:hypothetical protein
VLISSSTKLVTDADIYLSYGKPTNPCNNYPRSPYKNATSCNNMQFDLLFHMHQPPCPYLVCTWIRAQICLTFSTFFHIPLHQVAKMTLETYSVLAVYVIDYPLSFAATPMFIASRSIDPWANMSDFCDIFTHSHAASDQDDHRKVQPPDTM